MLAIEEIGRREIHQQWSEPLSLWLVNVGFVNPLVRFKLQACWTVGGRF